MGFVDNTVGGDIGRPITLEHAGETSEARTEPWTISNHWQDGCVNVDACVAADTIRSQFVGDRLAEIKEDPEHKASHPDQGEGDDCFTHMRP